MNRVTILLFLCTAIQLSIVDLSAQGSPAPSPVASSTLIVPPTAVTVDDPVAATKAWLDTVPADKRARSDAYFEGGYWLILWNFLVRAGVLIFLLQSRISARVRDFAESITRLEWLQTLVYAVAIILIVAILTFPLTAYENFFREHQYDMATQTFGPWFGEQIIALIFGLISGSFALIILYAIFRRAQKTWPIWGTVVAVLLSMFGAFIDPVFIEPVFNTYKPINDPAIRDPILTLARANEIPVTQVFEFDASRQTRRISANVAGFFGTTRIALNDNLLKRCTLPEIRQVMAHEMGHYVLNHSAKLITSSGILVFIGLLVARPVFNDSVRRWGERWGVRGIADPAGLPLLALIFSAYSFVLTPVTKSNTRTVEREADGFGINTSREPDGFAAVSLKLGEYRKLDPGKWEEIVFFDHPSGRARIRMAMDWKAAHLPCGGESTSAR